MKSLQHRDARDRQRNAEAQRRRDAEDTTNTTHVSVWHYGLVLLWSVTLSSLLFWFFHGHGFDDPYITYRYALNIAQGNGFVYNLDTPVLSTTTPFYTLLLVPFAMAGLDIPLVSNGISCISLVAGGVALWHLGRTWRTPLAGIAALLLYPTFPLLIMTLGAETTLYGALILAGFAACARERFVVMAVLFALATLTRADGVLSVGIVGLFILITHWRRANILARSPASMFATLPKRVWLACGVYVALLVPWFAFAWLTFGTSFPVTLAAKQQQGTMAISQSFFDGLLDQASLYWGLPTYKLFFLLALVGLLFALLYHRHWLLLISWSVLYTIAYSLLGVTSYFWYYAPVVAGFVVLVALGYAAIVRMVGRLLPDVVGSKKGLTQRRRGAEPRRANHEAEHAGIQSRLYARMFAAFPRRDLPGWGQRVVAIGLLFVLLLPQTRGIFAMRTMPDSRLIIYREVGTWLRQHTPQDASVGTLEVGIIGYYAQRRMIDFAGLIQPVIAQQITATTTYEDLAHWAFEQFQPDYVVLQAGMFPHMEQDATFVQQCEPVKEFAHEQHTMVVYGCGS